MIGVAWFVDDDGYRDPLVANPEGFVLDTTLPPAASNMVVHRRSAGPSPGRCRASGSHPRRRSQAHHPHTRAHPGRPALGDPSRLGPVPEPRAMARHHRPARQTTGRRGAHIGRSPLHCLRIRALRDPTARRGAMPCRPRCRRRQRREQAPGEAGSLATSRHASAPVIRPRIAHRSGRARQRRRAARCAYRPDETLSWTVVPRASLRFRPSRR